MVLTLAEKRELWEIHWAALDDAVAYWPASDAVDATNAFKPDFPAKQGDHPCVVLDREGSTGSSGFFEIEANGVYRTLVLKRTAPLPRGMDRYYWPAEDQWLEVVAMSAPGTNGPVRYVTTRDIDPPGVTT